MYNQAKLEKLKEIKRLMYELMSEEGNAEMSEEELEEKLDEAGEAAADADKEEMSGEKHASEMAEDEMEMEEPNYFQPKDPTKKPGTAVVFARPPEPKPSLKDAIPAPKSRKGKYA